MIETPPNAMFRILGTYQSSLVVLVPQNQDISRVPGMESWLRENDAQLDAEGLVGYLFPTRMDQVPTPLEPYPKEE